jgi:chromosome segregation ATPase
MNLANILTRRDPLKRAFVTLEDGMSDVLKEEFMLPVEGSPVEEESAQPEMQADTVEQVPAVEEPPATPEFDPPVEEPVERFTAHTQQRLAGYNAYEEARARAQDDLNRIGEALSGILTSQHMNREFLNDIYADIHRANELENANVAFAVENRRLTDRLDKLEKLRARYDQLVEVLKRREQKLLGEAEAARETLAALRLEVVEARNTISRSESLHGELQSALAARSNEAERFMREVEILREKNVSLSVELDLVQKKHSDARRRADELSSLHTSDSARLADVMARLVAEEGESTRLQKHNDALEAKLIEANESASRFSSELNERDKRHQSENQALRAEVQALNLRLQTAISEQRDTAVDVTNLRSKLSETESEKHVLEKKFAAVFSELELVQRQHTQAEAAAGDAGEFDQQRRQMQAEIAELRSTVDQLRQYETLYNTAKSRSRNKAEIAQGFSVNGGKIVPEFTPPKQARAS